MCDFSGDLGVTVIEGLPERIEMGEVVGRFRGRGNSILNLYARVFP